MKYDDTGKLPDITDVRAAGQTLAGEILATPILRCDLLDQQAGREVWVKAECLQHTGSFKYRGARNRILNLTQNERENGVIAYSSGNHAQGVALAAKQEGITCSIIMPKDTPKVKIDGVLASKAQIIFYDRLHEDRQKIATELAAEQNAVLIEPFSGRFIIAGQGTLGLEIAAHPHSDQFEAVVTNAGGGGLTAGIALALEADLPDCDLYTCEPEGFDDHMRSFVSGQRERNTALSGTICDALMTQTPGEMSFAINRGRVRGGLVVSDDEVKAAMRFAFSHLKLVIEPGGAVSLAAALHRKVPGTGPICVIASGGNVDPNLFQSIITAP